MKKQIFFVAILAIFACVGLYSLPKVVVETKVNSQPEVQQTPATHDTNNNKHEANISPSQQAEINRLKLAFGKATPANKTSIAKDLIIQYKKVSRFDSVAYLAESLEKESLKIADAYFEAFTFAANPGKATFLGEKTRKYYQQVLAQQPNNLLVKTNMAMTYTATENPMQGILMLREVIAQNPDYEPALFNLGLLSMRSNQFGKAVERFRQILKTSPNNAQALFYLGVSLAESGNKAEAKQVLESVLKTSEPALQATIRSYLSELK